MPAWAWNDTFPVDMPMADWATAAFCTMFKDARAERNAVLNDIALTYPGVAVGDVVQSASGFWGFCQNFADTNHAFFVRTKVSGVDITDFDGEAEIPTWTLADMRAEAGLHADGWRRSRPREISAISDTVDTFGNARAASQVAIGSQFSSIKGQLFRYVTGTNWTEVSYSNYAPDLVDSTLSAPNNMPYGQCQSGDYIRSYLFTQIRDVFNLLVWTPAKYRDGFAGVDVGVMLAAYGQTRSFNTFTTFGDGYGTAALARGAAETGFDAGSTTTVGRDDDVAQLLAYSDVNYTPINAKYNAKLTRVTAKPLHYHNAGDDLNRDVDFYIFAVAPNGTPSTADNDFDAQSDDVLEDQHRLIETVAATAKEALGAYHSTFVATKPLWNAADPSPGSPASRLRGWVTDRPPAGDVRGWLASVARWDVTGGFAYTAAT